jgi:hypothetical protein
LDWPANEPGGEGHHLGEDALRPDGDHVDEGTESGSHLPDRQGHEAEESSRRSDDEASS